MPIEKTYANLSTIQSGNVYTAAAFATYNGALAANSDIRLPTNASGTWWVKLEGIVVSATPTLSFKTFDGSGNVSVKRIGQADATQTTLALVNGVQDYFLAYDGTTYRLTDSQPGTVDLAAEVTGILPKANGGAGADMSSVTFPSSGTIPTIASTDTLTGKTYDTAGSGNVFKVNGTQVTTISQFLDLVGNTQGNILYRGATGWSVLAPGTAGYVLSTNGAGANPAWAAPSGGWTTGVLFASGSTSAIVSNTAVETTILTGTIPGGTLGTGGQVAFRLHGQVTNNSGSSQTWTLKIKYGTTTLFADTGTNLASSVSPHTYTIDGILWSDGATNAQRVEVRQVVSTGTNPATGYGAIGGTPSNSYSTGGGTAAEDSTADKTFSVTVTWASYTTGTITQTMLRGSAWKQ